MVKDLEIIKEFDKQIRMIDSDINRLNETRNNLYAKKGKIEDRIRTFSKYDTEEIGEIIKDLMQETEGIPYMVCDGIKSGINSRVVRPKENIHSGPIFKLPYSDTCVLKPSSTIDNSDNNLYVYEFINFVYKERSKANMEEIDYSELSAILSEYLDLVKSKDGGKKLIK